LIVIIIYGYLFSGFYFIVKERKIFLFKKKDFQNILPILPFIVKRTGEKATHTKAGFFITQKPCL